MEKFEKYSTAVRICPSYKQPPISNNQWLAALKKNELDAIYEKEISTQKIYQSIFQSSIETMFKFQSTFLCMIGGHNSGKTYSIAGEKNNISKNPGILMYFMRTLFSQLKHENKDNCSNKYIQFRFLQVNGDKAENIGFEMVFGTVQNDSDVKNRMDYKVDIKSLSHLESCISKIYEIKKHYMNLIIEIKFHRDVFHRFTSNPQKKSTITFLELSSMAFDESSIYYNKIQKELQSLIIVLQNLSRINKLDHLLEMSKLTQVLKNNILNTKNFHFIGCLGSIQKQNESVLRCLQMTKKVEKDMSIVRNITEDIRREQQHLTLLSENHRKVMTIISRCIGMDLNHLDKLKACNSHRNIEVSLSESLSKKYEKMKMANLRKHENELQLEHLKKETTILLLETDLIKAEYADKIAHLEKDRKLLREKHHIILRNLENMKTPPIQKFESCQYRNLFWTPKGNSQNRPPALKRPSQAEDVVSKHPTINEIKSFNEYQEFVQHTPKTKNQVKWEYRKPLEQDLPYRRANGQAVLERKKREQAQLQIGLLLQLINQQQQYIHEQHQQYQESLGNNIINRIKSSDQNLALTAKEQQLLSKAVKEHPVREAYYEQYLADMAVTAKVAKEFVSVQKDSTDERIVE